MTTGASYLVRKSPGIGTPAADWNRPAWETADTLEVTHFPWKDSGHRPRTRVRLIHDATYLGLIFRVDDAYVRAVARDYQDAVCRDSCVEFFVAPVAGSDTYFNFEVNCCRTMLLYRNPPPEERSAGKERMAVSESDWRKIKVASTMEAVVDPEVAGPVEWTLEYHIPFDLFEIYFENVVHSSGTRWRANFYKCGDATSHPHWGSWAPVKSERPNFHVPSSFREISFE